MAIWNTLDVGFTLGDASGRTISACPRYAAILGRPIEDAVGVTMECVTHPDDIKVNRWLLDQLSGFGDGFVVRKRYIRADGTIQWVENRVIRLGNGGKDLLPTTLVASCPIPDPRPIDLTFRPADSCAEYVTDMAEQLAHIANGARMDEVANLLTFAASAAARRVADDHAD